MCPNTLCRFNSFFLMACKWQCLFANHLKISMAFKTLPTLFSNYPLSQSPSKLIQSHCLKLHAQAMSPNFWLLAPFSLLNSRPVYPIAYLTSTITYLTGIAIWIVPQTCSPAKLVKIFLKQSFIISRNYAKGMQQINIYSRKSTTIW